MIYIFDIDGTLIDSRTRHSVLLERLLRKYSIDLDRYSAKDYMDHKANGSNTAQYLKEILQLPEATIKMISDEWKEKIEDHDLIMENDSLYVDALEALYGLKRSHLIFYLSCRKSRYNLIEELKSMGIYHFAKDIMVCDPYECEKEKTQAVDHIKIKYRSDLIIVGDTEVDYKVAKNTRSFPYILNRGFRSEKYWKKRGILSYKDLKKLTESPIQKMR